MRVIANYGLYDAKLYLKSICTKKDDIKYAIRIIFLGLCNAEIHILDGNVEINKELIWHESTLSIIMAEED